MNDCIDKLPAGVMIVDHEHKIIDANTHCERILGYSVEELIGKCVHDLVPEDKRAKHITASVDFMKHPSEKRLGIGRDLCGLHKEGHVVPIEISLTPMNGKVLVTMIDISIRQKVQEIHAKLEKLTGVLTSTVSAIKEVTGGSDENADQSK